MSYCDELASDSFGHIEQCLATANRLDEAQDLTRQANDCFVTADYPAAERLYWRALALKKEAVGPNHLTVAATLEDLSELHEIQDNLAEATRFYEFSVLVKERVFGSYHPEVARSMKKLSRLYRQMEEDSCQSVQSAARMLASQGMDIERISPHHGR